MCSCSTNGFLIKLHCYGILYLFIFLVLLGIHNVKLILQSWLRKHSKMSYTLISTGSIYSIYTMTQYVLSLLFEEVFTLWWRPYGIFFLNCDEFR